MADSKKIYELETSRKIQPITITLENSGKDNTVAFDQDDITEDVLDKIGDYVSTITKEAHNDPVLQNESSSVEKVSQQTSLGNPAALTTDKGSANYRFIDSIGSGNAKAIFDQSSNSGFLPITIRKGKTDDKSQDSGQNLLTEVNVIGKNSKLVRAIGEALTKNNRYSSEENTYIDPNIRLSEENSDNRVGHAILQKELGIHTPGALPSIAGDGSNTIFRISNLKNLGLQTLLEASGEYFVPDDTEDFASVVAAKAASSAPGLSRLGLKVPVSRFSAATIAAQVNPEFKKDSRFPSLNAPRQWSYGNPNNPLVPFDAISSTSAGIAAVLLTITITLLIKALAEVIGPDPIDIDLPSINLGGAKDRPTQTSHEVRVKRLGSYLGEDNVQEGKSNSLGGLVGSFGRNFFLLKHTEAEYSKAVQRGSEIFFGADPSGGVLGGIVGVAKASFGFGDTFKNVSQNPGYFNVLLRMLVRSVAESIGSAVDTIGGLTSSIMGTVNPVEQSGLMGPLDIDRSIGLDADPTNALNALNSIKDSKILRFMDILATIGDISLAIEENSKQNFISSIDAVDDEDLETKFPNPASLIKKDRLTYKENNGRHSEALAWSSNTLRSLYLLPSSLTKAELGYSGQTNMSSYLAGNPNFKLETNNNRLSQDDVKAIESELDAYYMPFYFHDLRTNDIISFHAFIDQITDRYDVDYSESQGFGRVGSTYAYKNTTRNLGCTFMVVATSKNDFSEMWYKVNRLVMLLYPQYTAGRSVSFTDASGTEKKFIQPFSQLIGNSPLIRFRLGDLIKSNYSDLDLARIFGAGTENFNATGDMQKSRLIEQNAEDLEKRRNRYLNYDFAIGDIFILVNPEQFNGAKKPRNAILKYQKKQNRNKTISVYSDIVLKVKQLTKDKKKYIVEFVDQVSTRKLDEHFVEADFTGLPGGSYVRLPDVKDLKVEQEETFIPQEDFFDPKLNPIVKSFDSVSGQGLAGFIKSIDFNWENMVWETEGLNYRAPMGCKITLNFLPVHDIAPGLDASGAPIGMPYNVGEILNAMKIKRRTGNKDKDSSVITYNTLKARAITPTRKT